jgi:hypothetical protein
MLIENRIATIIAAGLASVLLVGAKTEFYWKRTDGLVGPLIFTFLCVVALGLFSLLALSLVGIVRERRSFKKAWLAVPMICVAAVVTTFYDPIGINAEALQPNVVYEACYEGTMNSATLTFRANGRVEYYSIGFFGFSRYREGTWVQRNDTLETAFPDSAAAIWGHCLVIDHERSLLRPLHNESSEIQFPGFELGPCKGRN